MTADLRLARSLVSLALAPLAGTAHADVTASFVIGGSTLSADIADSSGIVSGSGSLDDVDLLFSTGEQVQTVAPSGFLISGTTTGGVDDPTRGSSMRLIGGFGGGTTTLRAGLLQIDLAADLRLVDEGTGSLGSTIVFELVSDSGDPIPFQVFTTGAGFGDLTAVTGTLFGDGTLAPGTYSVSVSLSDAGESAWSLAVLPAPGTPVLALGTLALGLRRRR
ncbi:MAG: hypothetical protein ACF8Q5_04240 [Phycisphaerales bacterium JB040]